MHKCFLNTDASALSDRCIETKHCMDVPNTVCSQYNTCVCNYKHKISSDRTFCEKRKYTVLEMCSLILTFMMFY